MERLAAANEVVGVLVKHALDGIGHGGAGDGGTGGRGDVEVGAVGRARGGRGPTVPSVVEGAETGIRVVGGAAETEAPGVREVAEDLERRVDGGGGGGLGVAVRGWVRGCGTWVTARPARAAARRGMGERRDNTDGAGGGAGGASTERMPRTVMVRMAGGTGGRRESW